MIWAGLFESRSTRSSRRFFCPIPGRGAGEGRGCEDSYYDRKFHTLGLGGGGGWEGGSPSFKLFPSLAPRPCTSTLKEKTKPSILFPLTNYVPFISARNFCLNFAASLSVYSVANATPLANSLFLCVSLYLSTLLITWK